MARTGSELTFNYGIVQLQDNPHSGEERALHDGRALPDTIPLAAKPRTVKANGISSDAITLYAGKRDAQLVMDLLSQHPFPEIDLVQYNIKRELPDEWILRLQIHNIQVNKSRAIKVYQADQMFRDELASSGSGSRQRCQNSDFGSSPPQINQQ
jgi:hypothetical protein